MPSTPSRSLTAVRQAAAGCRNFAPAGRLLDRALAAAGIDRQAVYVTNVVKHFKWEPRGKRRIHKKPRQREIDACRPWIVPSPLARQLR